jgi:hypothetical protein
MVMVLLSLYIVLFPLGPVHMMVLGIAMLALARGEGARLAWWWMEGRKVAEVGAVDVAGGWKMEDRWTSLIPCCYGSGSGGLIGFNTSGMFGV